MGEAPRFSCPMCGDCCRMSPVSLLPHEEVVLRRLAEGMGAPFRARPGYTMYDEVSGFNLAFSYVMELVDGRCPFLRGTLCSINGVYKPLICRSFPYIPREVRYNIDRQARAVAATADYGLSLACPVIKRHRPLLERMGEAGPGALEAYMPSEVEAAREMERARGLLLALLSALWRAGVVELADSRPGAPVANLYVFLIKHFPSLPHVLGVDRVARAVEGVAGG